MKDGRYRQMSDERGDSEGCRRAAVRQRDGIPCVPGGRRQHNLAETPAWSDPRSRGLDLGSTRRLATWMHRIPMCPSSPSWRQQTDSPSKRARRHRPRAEHPLPGAEAPLHLYMHERLLPQTWGRRSPRAGLWRTGKGGRKSEEASPTLAPVLLSPVSPCPLSAHALGAQDHLQNMALGAGGFGPGLCPR